MINPDKRDDSGVDGASMDGVAYEELRSRFRSFVSDDVLFRKFVWACNVKARQSGRLIFWQDKLWMSFVSHDPEAAGFGLTAILEAFHVCHIHMQKLNKVDIPIRRGVWDIYRSPEFNARINREAPFSESECLDSQAWGVATHITVDRCDECFAERMRIECEYSPA